MCKERSAPELMLIQPYSFSKLELKLSLKCQVLATSQEPSTTLGVVAMLTSRSMLISKEGEDKIKT